MSGLTFERQRDLRVIRSLGHGARSVLRRQSTIRASSLAVYGTRPLGASTVVARAANLEGRIVAGATFTLSGVSGAYTVGEDSEAASGAVTLAFSPPLASAVADGAALTITQAYGEASYPSMTVLTSEADIKEVAAGDRLKVIPWSATKPAPAPGDLLDGFLIRLVEPFGFGGVTRYRVTIEVGNA